MSRSETRSPPIIRRLRPDDAGPLTTLRRDALRDHPLVFSADPDGERSSVDFIRGSLAASDEKAIFGAFDGAGLVGMVGVIREAGVKQRHKATIWGMYVAAPARGRGAGRALLETAVAHARGWTDVSQLHLGVSDVAVEARSLYEDAGFVAWGLEPRALQWEGRFVDEAHLVLDLRKAPG